MTKDNFEYQAIRENAAIIDLSKSGKICLRGGNGVLFLNGLVSNDVKSLLPGRGIRAAFPNLQGKLIALARIYRDDDSLLLEVDEINRAKIVQNLGRFVAAGDFFIEDQTDDYVLYGIEGPKANEVIATLGVRLADEPEYRHEWVEVNSVKVRATVHRRCGLPGFDLFVPNAGAESIYRRLEEAGAVGIGPETFELVRIEAGVPREGIDTGEEYIILETGLENAISYTKGCYLGQEVIARIHWRGQPARQLRGLLLDTPLREQTGVELRATDGPQAGRRVGNVTSSAVSPALGTAIALGYVHRHYLKAGTKLELWWNDQCLGMSLVADLPFTVSVTGK